MSTTKLAIIGLLTALMVVAGAAADAAAPNSNESQQYLQNICGNTSFPQKCIDALSKASNFSDPRSLLNSLFHEATKECERVKILHMVPAVTKNKNTSLGNVYQCCSKNMGMAVYNLNLAAKSLNSLGTPGTRFSGLIDEIKQGITNYGSSAEKCYQPTACVDYNLEYIKLTEIKMAVNGILEFCSVGLQLAEELPVLLKNSGINLDTSDP